MTNIEEVIIGLPFGPVATVLLSALVFIFVVWLIQLVWSNGAKIRFLRGVKQPNNRLQLVAVGVVFLIIALVAYQLELGFDSPVLLVAIMVIMIVIQSWEVGNFKRTLTVFVVGLMGALIGHNLIPFLEFLTGLGG